jgi:hypothetical protein
MFCVFLKRSYWHKQTERFLYNPGIMLQTCNASYRDYISLVHMNDWVWNIGGMILTGGNWTTWLKTCLSATLSTTTNPICNGLWFNLGLHGDRLSTTYINAWATGQPVNILIYTVSVYLLLCATWHTPNAVDVWLLHSADVHPQTDSVLTLYCTICVTCPSSHNTVTSQQVTSIHKQLYR